MNGGEQKLIEAIRSLQHFAWNDCWKGGKTHGSMWSEMREHHRAG